MGAKLVDFGGWDLPLHYGSQIEEHLAVRRDAGMFDVSHMGIVDLTGSGVRDLLRLVLANDVAKLEQPGRALYSCMLLPSGGVLDDLIAYFMTESWFRLVVNAATRAKDLAWLRAQAAPFGVDVREIRHLSMIAVQGPNARTKTLPMLPADGRAAALNLGRFEAAIYGDFFVARTGYTGEDGFEIVMPHELAAGTFQGLYDNGVVPAGLGARDTLRLEAGLNLYGQDMDEAHHPLESGLAWTVAFGPQCREFIGRQALERLRAAAGNALVGLVLEERGVLRRHQAVTGDRGVGEVTSGTYSPSLDRSIALARLPRFTAGRVQVDIRGKAHAARVVKPPFVRDGKSTIPA
jgi:aminomethyltransferase